MLAIAGYSVSSPREPLDAILLLQHDEYLAVLIGHSVLPAEGEAIAAKAKALHVAAIFVYQGKVKIPAWADLSVDDREIGKLVSYLDRADSMAS
jgi:hypothetical protein